MIYGGTCIHVNAVVIAYSILGIYCSDGLMLFYEVW